MWRCPYCFAEMLTRSRSGHLKSKQGCSQQHALHLAEEAKKKEEVLCFDNAICFSLAIWFALRDAVLCATPFFAPSCSLPRWVNFLALFVLAFALPLSPLEEEVLGPCLSLHFLVPFWQEEHKHSRTGTPTACIRCPFFHLLFLALQAQQPKFFARFAPLCAPRAINRRG